MASGIGAVSPHLDDLVLSCAGLLAAHPGSSMVTIFASGPSSVDPVTGWEDLSGLFQPGADIVGVRRNEDVRASGELGATCLHLDHWDHQYRNVTYAYRGPSEAELERTVSADLEGLIDRSDVDTWAIPMGLSHPDHEIAAAAGLDVAERLQGIDWLVYEDLPYAVYQPRKVQEAASTIRSKGFELQLVEDDSWSGNASAKRRAANCYRSQLLPLGEAVGVAINTPERIYRLSRRRR
jgi:LmbE family N-acetylglucosaminyl deacetylase